MTTSLPFVKTVSTPKIYFFFPCLYENPSQNSLYCFDFSTNIPTKPANGQINWLFLFFTETVSTYLTLFLRLQIIALIRQWHYHYTSTFFYIKEFREPSSTITITKVPAIFHLQTTKQNHHRHQRKPFLTFTSKLTLELFLSFCVF